MLTSLRLLTVILTSALAVCHPFTASAAAVADSTACASPAATITYAPVDAPRLGGGYDLHGSTYVQVDIDKDSTVVGASVLKSSGERQLDNEALLVARNSTFKPEMRDCVPVGGSYVFIVDFPQ